MEVSLKQAPCCPEPRFEVKHKKDLHRAAKLLILAMGVDGSHHGVRGHWSTPDRTERFGITPVT